MTEIPSSRIKWNSFLFSSFSCYLAEVSCASVFKLAFSMVQGTLPFMQIHCPLILGSSRFLIARTLISSSNSDSGEVQVLSIRKICSFLVQQRAPWVVRTIYACIFSLAARVMSWILRESLRSLLMNFIAVSTRRRVSSSISVCSVGYWSCVMSRSAACDLTMWSIKLGFVNNVIQQPHLTFKNNKIQTPCIHSLAAKEIFKNILEGYSTRVALKSIAME